MTVAYIAHPISDNPQARVEQVKQIQFDIYQNEPDVIPFAPYLRAVECLDDSDPAQRKQGMSQNEHFLTAGIVDELWLYGDHFSDGMRVECLIALREQIPIVAMTEQMEELAESYLRISERY